MTRPSLDQYFLAIAAIVATRGTCLRRQVGCALVDARGHVLATGYNGRPSGWPHCNAPLDRSSSVNGTINLLVRANNEFPSACAGALRADGKRWPSGHNLDACEAIHAEQNALLQCQNVYNLQTCYVSVSPCVTCVKLLLNTSCQRVVFSEQYAHNEASRALWLAKPKAEWVHLKG